MRAGRGLPYEPTIARVSPLKAILFDIDDTLFRLAGVEGLLRGLGAGSGNTDIVRLGDAALDMAK